MTYQNDLNDLRLNLDNPNHFFSPHGAKPFFFVEKSPTHNNVAPKLNARGQISEGGFKSSSPDSVHLNLSGLNIFNHLLQHIL